MSGASQFTILWNSDSNCHAAVVEIHFSLAGTGHQSPAEWVALLPCLSAGGEANERGQRQIIPVELSVNYRPRSKINVNIVSSS